MKKIFQTFFIFLVFLTLSGCGFFGSTELGIASITTEEKDDKLYLVITYTDEFTEPSYFELAQGEDGARGNGIAEIITDDETKPGYTLVTVKYTDTSLHDEKFELPHGVSIENVIVEPKKDADGNLVVDEDGNPTGEEELVISFTGEKESIRIPYNKPQDGKDGREIQLRTNETHIQWRYSGEDDEAWQDLIPIESLKGQAGSIITKVEAGTSAFDSSKYFMYIYIDDSDVPFAELEFPAPTEPAQWHTGNSYPPSNLGKVGDFYLDKTNALIYQKQSEHNWGDAIVSFGSPNADCTVTFIATKGSIKGSDELTVKYGTYFYGTSMNIPTVDAPDGYDFIGWSTSENPNESNGYFTDLTPVYGNITLYAVFQEK